MGAWVEKAGTVFSIVRDNAPVPGCTVSEELWGAGGNAVICFSLAAGTDISAEIYGNPKLLLVCGGKVEVRAPRLGTAWPIMESECLVTPAGTPVGMSSEGGAAYLEISINREEDMNEAVKAGEAFRLADLVPYQAGRIVNMDIAHNDKMKFVVMAFDEGTGLSEHAAPGEALVFALEGKGIIGYEGREHHLAAGEQFCFAKGGKHWVKADGRFKMALLLTLE